ncbi:MAG: glycosyltransferase [Saccharofermentans sp.]|nr:glycosyltransferase [Saccharofermentans sp.]
MKVFQLLTTLSFGDAVSNDTLAINDLLKERGFETKIYMEHIDPRLANHPDVMSCGKMPKPKKDDIMLYHLSTGSNLNLLIRDVDCRKFIIYHNTTPPHFFAPYSGRSAQLCSNGINETKLINDIFEGGFCDSAHNRDMLWEYGYKCPLKVRPILIPFEDYMKRPDRDVMLEMGGSPKKNNHKVKNVLFVGRIAPNKKQEDLISMLYAYRQMYSDPIRLILVGNPGGMEKYDAKLKNYAQELGIDDVVFTGHISFPAILAYYRTADAFVSMSEHEGFCVPLVEAMQFDVPILAYASTAVPETLGDCGIVFDDKDPAYVAAQLHEVLHNEELRATMIEEQRERLKYFGYDNVSSMFIQQLEELTGIKAPNGSSADSQETKGKKIKKFF